MRNGRRLITLALCMTSLWAAQSTEANRRSEALARDLTTQRALDIARERRVFGEREERLLAQLNERDKGLRRLKLDLSRSRQEQVATQLELDGVTAERARLVEEAAGKNREFAAEIGEYRRQMAGLTEAATPELRAALERFADGDRVGAMPVIEQIKRAQMRARERAAAIRNAADVREVAALKVIMKDRGELSTLALVPVWEEAQELDPGYHWGWVELRRLYTEAGQLGKARAAAERALAQAGDDRALSASLMELGDVLVEAGELGEARKRFEQSLAISEKLAAANPGSAVAQQDVSVSLSKLGAALVKAGQLGQARRRLV